MVVTLLCVGDGTDTERRRRMYKGMKRTKEHPGPWVGAGSHVRRVGQKSETGRTAAAARQCSQPQTVPSATTCGEPERGRGSGSGSPRQTRLNSQCGRRAKPDGQTYSQARSRSP